MYLNINLDVLKIIVQIKYNLKNNWLYVLLPALLCNHLIIYLLVLSLIFNVFFFYFL